MLFEKEEVASVIDVMKHSVGSVASEKEKDEESSKCVECKKYKEVYDYKEAVIKKAHRERKALGDKLKSMAGQRKFFFNKSKGIESELKEAKKENIELKARISTLEQQNDTTEEPASSLVMPEVLVVEEVAAAPENPAVASTVEGYKCRRCGEDRESIRSLSDHMRVKHPNVQFKCQKCPTKFPFKSTLRNHVRVAHPATVHPCTVCQTVFLLKSGLIAHRATKCRTPAPRQQQSSGQVSAPPMVAPQVAAAAPQVAVAAPQFGAPQFVAPQVVTAAPQVAAPQFGAPQVVTAAPQVATAAPRSRPPSLGPLRCLPPSSRWTDRVNRN